MTSFFERPILNSPYEYPGRHRELDADGQPTNRIIEIRRRSELITPVPKPKKRKCGKGKGQAGMVFDHGEGPEQRRQLPNPSDRRVTSETAVQSHRPFFCQVEASRRLSG